MTRPILLAMAIYASLCAGNSWGAPAAQKPGPAPKGGWTAVEVPASPNDPAYAAYDEGRYADALKLAAEAAAKGEVQANTLLGLLYDQGLGIRKDEVKAAEWYTKGATAGDKHAQFHLGVMLAEGRGLKKDLKKSADFFEAAAQQDHTLAAYNLGQSYIAGWA